MNDQPIGVTGTGGRVAQSMVAQCHCQKLSDMEGQVVSAVSKINAILQDLVQTPDARNREPRVDAKVLLRLTAAAIESRERVPGRSGPFAAHRLPVPTRSAETRGPVYRSGALQAKRTTSGEMSVILMQVARSSPSWKGVEVTRTLFLNGRCKCIGASTRWQDSGGSSFGAPGRAAQPTGG